MGVFAQGANDVSENKFTKYVTPYIGLKRKGTFQISKAKNKIKSSVFGWMYSINFDVKREIPFVCASLSQCGESVELLHLFRDRACLLGFMDVDYGHDVTGELGGHLDLLLLKKKQQHALKSS